MEGMEDFCLERSKLCIDLVVGALVEDQKSLLEMSEDLLGTFPALAGMSDDDRCLEMLNLVIAAAHRPSPQPLLILEAAHNALKGAEHLRALFRVNMTGFMIRVRTLTGAWDRPDLPDEDVSVFRRISVLDIPADETLIEQYSASLGCIERDLGLCIDRDDIDRFKLLLKTAGRRGPTRSQLVNLFYTRDDTLSPKIRAYAFGSNEATGEEIYARILNPVNGLNFSGKAEKFIPPSSMPKGFFESQSDLIWYSIGKDLDNSKTIQPGDNGRAPASKAAIHQASLAMEYLLRQGSIPFYGIQAARGEGHNLGSIDLLKKTITPTNATKHLLSSLMNMVHIMANDGTLFSTETGSAKGYAIARAMARYYGPKGLESAITSDAQRALLYRVSGNKEFLEGVKSEVARSQLLEADLGL